MINATAFVICNPTATGELISSATQSKVNNGATGSTGYQTETAVVYADVPTGGKIYWRPARSGDLTTDGKLELVEATGIPVTSTGLTAAFTRQATVSGSGTYTPQSGQNLTLGTEYASMGFWASDTFISAVQAGSRTLDSGGAGECYPEGNDLFRANNVTITSSGVVPATSITFTGSVPADAADGTVAGTLTVGPSAAVSGTFSEVSPTNANFEIQGNQVVVSAGASLSAGTVNLGVRYDNTSAGGGVYSTTISIPVLATTATSTRIGRYTPQSAEDIPVTGATNETYGQFEVNAGFADWSTVPLTAGTTTVGTSQIIVSGNTQTVAHINDASCYDWTGEVEFDCEPEAIKRSMGLSDPDSLLDARDSDNLPNGVSYNASTKVVTVGPVFAGGTLGGLLFQDCLLSIAPNAPSSTKITDCAFRLTSAVRDFFPTRNVIDVNANIAEVSYCQYLQPLDFGYPAKAVFGMGANVISLIQYNWIGDHGADCIKPHNGSQNQTIQNNYFGCGGTTSGKFRGDYSSGATYSAGEFVKRGSNPNAGYFRSRTNGNQGNALPANSASSSGTNTHWKWYDPHSDLAQSALLDGVYTFQNNVVNHVPYDNAGYGQHSHKGLVSAVCRFNNKNAGLSPTTCSIIIQDNLLLRDAEQNRPGIHVFNDNGSVYFPDNCLTVRRNVIGAANPDDPSPEDVRSQFFEFTGSVLNTAANGNNRCANTGKAITASGLS